ncbi:vegetative incompatibility protein HET-E-1 [Byssothecium circinans]|uniref:Vegetative incompatibility protein HET-E-1 n=1 Tax=Byssothecium circinans TaxID=147558 RepID=A0A6A5THR3_9PLEO|nr:vegetative incompatibility protein HET-E-1 [Byssothecium circinans]
MALLYGEGKQKAKNRLLKEIENENSWILPIAEGASFDSHMQEHNPKCLPNTRTELLCHIRKWANDRNSKSLFWIKGMAGTGKSTIARTVAQSFADQHQLGASFFFKSGEGERGNATRFFTTIAMDLIARVPGMRPGIRKAINADPAISEKALKDQFEKLILGPLSEAVPRQNTKLVVVIDAMDECKSDEDIRAILQLLPRTRALKSVSLRVFVTSRPELPIRLEFRQMHNSTYEDLVLHEVAKQTVERDIRMFITHELEEIQQRCGLPLDWPSKSQTQALVKLAVPLFIVASTACRYIGDHQAYPKKRLDGLLGDRKTRASTPGATYHPILAQLINGDGESGESWVDEFRRIVGSIVILESPLSMVSLAHLLDMEKEEIRCRLDSLHSVLSIPDNEDLPIRLLHLSFRDFLVDPGNKDNNAFWVDEKQAHKRLASDCLKLMAKRLRKNMCNLLVPGTSRRHIKERTISRCLPPELKYACSSWVHHVERGEDRIHDGEDVYTFLTTHFLHWLEALCIMEQTFKCIHMINTLQSLVDPVQKASSKFLHDAKRFVLRFRHVLEDTPLQIYSSALIFAPESTIRKTLAHHTPKWIGILPSVEDDCDACHSTIEGHEDVVNAVAASLDGKLLASASADKTVRLWDTATGACHSTLSGHGSSVTAMAFSPDSKLVVSGSADTTIRLWSASTGAFVSVFRDHSDSVTALAVSSDSKLVASASADKTVKLWDIGRKTCHSTLEGHSSTVGAIAFSPESDLIVSASADSELRLWDTKTGSCLGALSGHSGRVTCVAFSPDGKWVASGSYDKTIRLWDVEKGNCCSKLSNHSDRIRSVTFSPDGTLLASASDDCTVGLWDTTTESCLTMLEGHSKIVSAVAFSPNNQLIASASDDHTVRLWDVPEKSCRSIFKGHINEVKSAVFSSHGQLVVSASNDKTLRLWDVDMQSHSSKSHGHTSSVTDIAFSHNGKLIASASDDCTVRLWDTTTGLCGTTFEGHSATVRTVAFSPNDTLVASASDDGTLLLWDAADQSFMKPLSHFNAVNAVVAFSPDSKLLASASNGSKIQVWELASGTLHTTLTGHSGGITAIAFSPSDDLIASASEDSTIRLWKWESTGEFRNIPLDLSEPITVIAFSPTGDLFASASDNIIQLWDTAKNLSCATFTCRWPIRTVSFSPDGSYLTTDRGTVPFLLSDFYSASPSQGDSLRTFGIGNEWVYSGQYSLWLPPEYRSTCTAVYGNKICLGHATGRVTIFAFEAIKELDVSMTEIYKEKLGPNHPDTLTSMAILASRYRKQRRWKEAEDLEVWVMETRMRVLGDEHPDTLTAMSNLAYTLRSQSCSHEALSLM